MGGTVPGYAHTKMAHDSNVDIFQHAIIAGGLSATEVHIFLIQSLLAHRFKSSYPAVLSLSIAGGCR